jgi:hypothetical protein
MASTIPSAYGLKVDEKQVGSSFVALRYDSSKTSSLPRPKLAGAMSLTSWAKFCPVLGSRGKVTLVWEANMSFSWESHRMSMGRQAVARAFPLSSSVSFAASSGLGTMGMVPPQAKVKATVSLATDSRSSLNKGLSEILD